MDEDRLISHNRVLKHFINSSLGLSEVTHKITGFHLVEALLDAAAYNTYIETVGDKADTLYLRIKESLSEMVTYSYLESIKRLSEKFGWKDKKVVLAFLSDWCV